MSVIVTGGAGFIGSCIVRTLNDMGIEDITIVDHICETDKWMNMRNKKWEADFSPIEADGASYVDTLYSKAYLRHLFHAQELLAMQIASIQNTSIVMNF